MKFFIGAKNLTGQVIVCEVIEAKDFYAALLDLQLRASAIAGSGPAVDGKPKFRITAVNEQPPIHDTRAVRGQVAQFLEGARA
jgi:hypothetical protein